MSANLVRVPFIYEEQGILVEKEIRVISAKRKYNRVIFPKNYQWVFGLIDTVNKK